MKKTILLLSAMAIISCNPAEQPSNGGGGNSNEQQGQTPGGENNPGTGDNPGAVDTPDFSPEPWYQTFFWDRTDREKGGLRGPVKSVHLSMPQYSNDRYNKYTFDEAGRLLKMEHFQTDTDEYNYSMTYTYDSQGRRIKMEYKEGSLTNGYTCEYENGDRYVAVSGTNWIHMYGVFVGDGNGYANCQDLEGIWKGLSAVHFHTGEEFWNETRDYEYVFDEDGNLTITLTNRWGQDKDNMSEETRVSYLTYKDGLPCSSLYQHDLGTSKIDVEWQSNGIPAKLVQGGGETYEYLPNGRTVLISKHYGYLDWGGMRGQEYFYDDHFDVTGYDLDIGDEQFGLHHSTYTEYTYDKYGNWTSRKESITPLFWDGTEEDKSVRTVYQVIEYY